MTRLSQWHKKIVFLYPGQGSQKVGMGKDLLEQYPPAKKIFEEANDILGFNLSKICLEGPEKELTRTTNLQPALLTVSWILTKLLKEKEVIPQAVAGHSLGEYSAILAAEVVDFPTALKIVKERARLMEEAGKDGKGAMAAVIGLDDGVVVDLCKEIKGVEAVNFNCPGQVVISGDKEKLEVASKELKRVGAKGVIFLSVTGAFHSFMVREAAKKFSSLLDQFPFRDPCCPVVSNVTGEYATSARQIKDNLKLQMDHPVLWEKGMRLLISDGFNIFVEVGPGKVLQGLMRRIDKKVVVSNVDRIESVKKLIQLLG
ncbi:ACP S-malonyltransferase [Candidatus Aerophobetes bacterium]|nr:ACP S-malonyltransferase [Candidatus Aerophobetes bacterium]